MRRWLPECVALPLLPWLIIQGKRTRRITPRLLDAIGPDNGVAQPKMIAGNPRPPTLQLLAIGESPVAGVGVATHHEAITSQFAAALATRLGRPVAWQAMGQNGATLHCAINTILPPITQKTISTNRAFEHIDVVLVVFGVNDSTAFRSGRRYAAELKTLLLQLQHHLSPRLIVVTGIPPLHLFPALPQPLRTVLGLKAQELDEAAQAVVAVLSQQMNVMLVPTLSNMVDPAQMASDGYHPSALGAAVWGRQLAVAVAPQLTYRKKNSVPASLG
ncbi:SGNH/GDSL hydrolase family protein [Glaciimonas sp. GG7]